MLLTLVNLYHTYNNEKFDPAIRNCIHSSLEKRWAKTGQTVFILAVVLNPYLRGDCFNDRSPFRTFVPVWDMVNRTYKRMFGRDPPPGLRKQLQLYLTRSDKWTDELMGLEAYKQEAKAAVCPSYLFVLFPFAHTTSRVARNTTSTLSTSGASMIILSRMLPAPPLHNLQCAS